MSSKLQLNSLRRRIRLSILGAAFICAASVIVAFTAFLPPEGVTLAPGQVAPVDILAPRSITYESEVLTRLARQSAADSVRDVYDPPNPAVLRQQIQLARNVLDYIDNVRHDSYATAEQQQGDLGAMIAVHPNDDMMSKILA